MNFKTKTLDEWYRTVNSIYLDRNFYRSLDSIYLHFIEVVGSLNLAGEVSRKPHVKPEAFLPKVLAWYFAYCGRAGIPSVERMLWAKFPNVCPYCRLTEHKSSKCKERDPAMQKVDWPRLRILGEENSAKKPKTLKQWQRMFNRIYPRDENTKHELNIKRLGEECSENAEAIRVISVAPQYLVSEAPDIFSWIMGFANQFDADRKISDENLGDELEQAMVRAYPDGCVACGFSVCKCPAILTSTLGRIAKEGPLDEIFPEKPGLFTLQESINFFGAAEKPIKIGDKEFNLNISLYKKLEADVALVLQRLDHLNGLNTSTVVAFTRVFSQLEIMARQRTVVQADIDKIVAFVQGQPSGTKNIITSFLVNLSASGVYSGVTTALVDVLSKLVS